ncbi:16S rRNA (adenine(1518)-N(6)/adenine(1519)-N(6))-dimethyltransferase RsmA [Eremococcus coleocola]|uniref:16S rRNA (adenine(1518)-N(6)/adenine(1519)-N(6))- dimethyltransferase RsmA n=1 Tax=Eremococcus coleocola TaxID=88132 RepID=UPI00040F9F7A|nr:16S rRNA (adenine(1518)-N(6)/adenine(1519)-N(6))-dimethyltransferase RsmA [Eremococcus coleocola]
MSEFRPIATPTRTAQIMKDYDIAMKKSLGQNFLIEPNILDKMVAAADIDSDTTVIEIGPGIGALTEFLALSAKQVLAFEIDARFVSILENTLAAYDNVKVIHQDILKVDFQAPEYASLKDLDRLVVVANLPYYITTPIIMHLIDSHLPFDRLVMMMQKEVAERMTAQVGTKAYNSLTIAIQLQMQARLDFIVPKNVFIPKPNVDSAVLVLERLATPRLDLADLSDFQNFVQAAFVYRRKTLWNNYKNAVSTNLADLSADQWEAIFDQAELDRQRRGESLSLEEFGQLYQAYLAVKG